MFKMILVPFGNHWSATVAV